MMFRIRLSLVTLSLFAGISAIAVAEEHNHDDEFSHQEQLSNTAGGSSKPWGEAILASLLVNLVTLVGVFFLSGEHVAKHVLKRDIAKSPYYLTFTQNVIPSFACGALLATTVFLMLPEALHLISAQFEDGHDHRLLREKSGENQASWRFGICIISGFLLPTLTELIFCHKIEVDRLQDITEAAVLDVESSKKNTSDSSETSENVKVDAETVLGLQCSTKTDLLVANLDRTDTKAIDWSLASSVLAGDFFHNFAGTKLFCLSRVCIFSAMGSLDGCTVWPQMEFLLALPS